MFCKKCGTKLDDGSLFCGKCGTPQDVAKPPVAVEPMPTPQPLPPQKAAPETPSKPPDNSNHESRAELPQDSETTNASPDPAAFCGSCGTKITAGSAFCPSCGAAVAEGAASQSENISASSESQQFKFDEPKYLLGIPLRGTKYKTVCTTIDIESGTLQIKQWNDGLFVDNTVNEFAISPQDISFIQMETLWDWKYIILVILQIAIALSSDEWFYKVMLGGLAVWNVLFGIKRKEVRLCYGNGSFLIPDSGSDTGSARELATLLQNLNPAIRVIGFEEK